MYLVQGEELFPVHHLLLNRPKKSCSASVLSAQNSLVGKRLEVVFNQPAEGALIGVEAEVAVANGVFVGPIIILDTGKE